jgi:hypothetical protein
MLPYRRPTYKSLRDVPFDPHGIQRDGVDRLIPDKRSFQLFDFQGTKQRSTRSQFRRNMQSAETATLGIQFTASGEPIALDDAYAKAAYPAVAGLVTESGDLKSRPSPAHGCFGVPYWRAMDLTCQTCEFRESCASVVDYRLAFGGRSHFDSALAEKDDAARWYDTGVIEGRPSQGYQREAQDLHRRICRSQHGCSGDKTRLKTFNHAATYWVILSSGHRRDQATGHGSPMLLRGEPRFPLNEAPGSTSLHWPIRVSVRPFGS